MNILVLLKRVPDTAAKVNVGADGLTIDPAGVEFVMNPYDEIAVEQAIQLSETKYCSATASLNAEVTHSYRIVEGKE